MYWRVALAVLVLCTGSVLLAVPERAEVRYAGPGDAGACLARQVIHLPEETEVLVLGSSRIRRAVSPEQFGTALGADGPVYNLGRPGLSTAREYVLLRDLYAAGYRPRVVVLEAALDVLRGAYDLGKTDTRWSWVQTTASFMTYGDHFNLPAGASDAGVLGYTGLVASGLSKKIRTGVSLNLSGRVKDASLNGSAPETVCMLPHFDNPGARLQERNAARKASERARIEAVVGPLETSHDGRYAPRNNGPTRAELFYLEKIRELTVAYGSALYVVRLHSYGRAPYSAEVTAALSAKVPEVLVPPDAVILSTNANFMDKTHMGSEARQEYTAWLASAIAARVN